MNRSFKDTEEGIDMGTAREKEASFFATHPEYSRIQSQLGTPYLVRQCTELLVVLRSISGDGLLHSFLVEKCHLETVATYPVGIAQASTR